MAWRLQCHDCTAVIGSLANSTAKEIMDFIDEKGWHDFPSADGKRIEALCPECFTACSDDD